MVAITGSVRAGMEVAGAAASDLKRVHLELGGKALVIVFDDADVERAAEAIAGAGYFNAGQDCTAATRVLVGPGVHDDFVAALTEQAKAILTGMPEDESILYRALNNSDQLDRVAGIVDRLPDHAVLRAGGRRQGTSRPARTSRRWPSGEPEPRRAALADSLVGDREPIAELFDTSRTEAAASTPSAERDWALDRLEQFHADGNRLSDVDGARMLLAVEKISTRDALWEDMSTRNTPSEIALWADLTRRAPDEVRAAQRHCWASRAGCAVTEHGHGAHLTRCPPTGPTPWPP